MGNTFGTLGEFDALADSMETKLEVMSIFKAAFLRKVYLGYGILLQVLLLFAGSMVKEELFARHFRQVLALTLVGGVRTASFGSVLNVI